MSKIIAFQGVEGAHSHLACRQAYPDHKTLACPSFEAVFAAVREGKADVGMIPVENSYAGRVAEVHNILANTDVHIVGEHFLRVAHHLMAKKGTKLQDVKVVESHPQALMQCTKNLAELGIKGIKVENTAIAAQNIAKSSEPNLAALASELAAEVNGLEILKRDMQDAEMNLTVFISIANEPIDPEPAENIVTTLLFRIRNIPAALYKSLGGFATNNVNLLKLESYIPGGHSDNADFFISFQGHPKERRVQLAIEELGFFTRKVKLLGVYAGDPERFK